MTEQSLAASAALTDWLILPRSTRSSYDNDFNLEWCLDEFDQRVGIVISRLHAVDDNKIEAAWDLGLEES